MYHKDQNGWHIAESNKRILGEGEGGDSPVV